MEIIRKKICLEEFRSHINGALDYVGSAMTDDGNFGAFVKDANSFDIAGWTGYCGTIRTCEMMRRYNILMNILRNSIHVQHGKNLSCQDTSNSYYNKFYLDFDYNGTFNDFLFNENTGVLYESAFTLNGNYYVYNGNEGDVAYDYVILISDDDAPIYEKYFGFDFVKEVHTIVYTNDNRFNQPPFIPINVLLTNETDNIGLMSLYVNPDEEENYDFPKNYSEDNKYDWFEKELFERYLEGPVPGYKTFTEDYPVIDSKLNTLRDKIYIQDDNGATLPAIFEDFPGAVGENKGKFFKAIFYTGASASDGIYETVDGVVVTNTQEQKPFPINSNVYYIIYAGDPDITTSGWTDNDGHVHYRETTHCDEYLWWEVIPSDTDDLVCADDEDVPPNTTQYRTQTIFETLKYVIIDTPASNGDYYYFLVKYDNGDPEMGGTTARIPFTEGEVFNKDAYEFEETITYTGDVIKKISIEDNYISFTYVLDAIFNDDSYTNYTGGTIYNETYQYHTDVEGIVALDGYDAVRYWYNYIDFDGAKVQIENKDFNLSRQGNVSEVSGMTTGDVWRKDDTVHNSPIIKEDYLMGITLNGINEVDVEINRGNAAAFESHFRLTECNSLDDIETNGNGGFFNIE